MPKNHPHGGPRQSELRCRKTPYDIRDGNLKSFGVRVMPSGRKRFFVHCQHRGERVWRIVGDAGNDLDVGEARIARRRNCFPRSGAGRSSPSANLEETLFEAVAETVMQRYERVWKPRTLYVNRKLSAQANPAALRRSLASPTSTGGRSGNGSPRLTRHTCRGRQVHAGAVRHHEGGGS